MLLSKVNKERQLLVHRDVMHSEGDRVNNIVLNLHGVGRLFTYDGDRFVRYIHAE